MEKKRDNPWRYPARSLYCLLCGLLFGHFIGHVFRDRPIMWAISFVSILFLVVLPSVNFLDRKIFGEQP